MDSAPPARRCWMGMALLPVPAPFPWQSILDYLSVRCTPLLESVDAGMYLRHGRAEARLRGESLAIKGDAAPLARLFDLDCPVEDVRSVLRRCPHLKPRLRQLPGVRVPGCWSPFELTVRAILGQQVSVRGAHTLMRRLNERCPDFRPDQVAACDLTGLGLTTSRAATIHAVAQAPIDFTAPWPEVAAHLKELRGIGPWTLAYLGMRAGRDPDSFPHSDLGLLHAYGARDPKELLRAAERWRPFRAYAAMLLWMAPQEADSSGAPPSVS